MEGFAQAQELRGKRCPLAFGVEHDPRDPYRDGVIFPPVSTGAWGNTDRFRCHVITALSPGQSWRSVSFNDVIPLDRLALLGYPHGKWNLHALNSVCLGYLDLLQQSLPITHSTRSWCLDALSCWLGK